MNWLLDYTGMPVEWGTFRWFALYMAFMCTVIFGLLVKISRL